MAESLKQVRAAQLRARALRGGIGRLTLGTLFLVGALAYARLPERHASASVTWMTLLLALSTLDVGLGLRVMARERRLSPRLWMAGAAAWGLLSLALLLLLLRV